MKKSIMNIDDAVMLSFESGCARLRFKERRILKLMPEENLPNLRDNKSKD